MVKSVRRITIIQQGAEGASTQVVYERSEGKRKSSRALRPMEKLQRRLLEANQIFADEALSRHNKYAEKRKDGWLVEMPRIGGESARKAFKKLTRI
jgi:hypothetical protein